MTPAMIFLTVAITIWVIGFFAFATLLFQHEVLQKSNAEFTIGKAFGIILFSLAWPLFLAIS